MRRMKRYIEIGTFDKFNLRYAMGLLGPHTQLSLTLTLPKILALGDDWKQRSLTIKNIIA